MYPGARLYCTEMMQKAERQHLTPTLDITHPVKASWPLCSDSTRCCSSSGVCLPLTSCNSEKTPRSLHPESQLIALPLPHNSRNHEPSQNWDTHRSWNKVNEIMNNLGGAILIFVLSFSIYCCNLFIFDRGCKLLSHGRYLQPCSSDNASQKSEHMWGCAKQAHCA